MRQVTVIGAGMAGLTAALRLLERGFDVTILEQDDFLGGKLGSHKHDEKGTDYHEHSYHMYLNWYHNFWNLVEEIGISDRFEPQSALPYIHRGQHNKTLKLENVGSPARFLQNLFSGVLPPLDMFVYRQSLTDLLGASSSPRSYLDRTSVLAFLNSRPYMTDEAMKLHAFTLAKAFACPTYFTEAHSYKRFIGYGFRHPDPMLWLLKGNTKEFLFDPLRAHLERTLEKQNQLRGQTAQLRIRLLNRVERIHLAPLSGSAGTSETNPLPALARKNRVCGLTVRKLARAPRIDEPQSGDEVATRQGRARYESVSGDVILAVPLQAVSRLVDEDMFMAAPELANVRRLRGKPMASVDVYFKRKLSNVPRGVTVLLDSPYSMTFLDLSQLWPQNASNPVTYLNVVISDYDTLAPYSSRSDIELAMEYVFSELRKYIEFDYDDKRWPPAEKIDDVDRGRCHFQSNVGEELFMNEVGSWEFRPEVTCGIQNLYMAGDYCKSFIDVVTIEAAVVSGLLAAEAVRRRAGIDEPVEILEPDAYPTVAMAALGAVGAPYAYGAKALALAARMFWSGYSEMFPDG